MKKLDHGQLKEMAKIMGVRVTDILAMSPKNDPFYVGTGAQMEMAMWFYGLWGRAGYSTGVHLRRVHYWCVSHGDVRLPRPIKQGDERSDLYMNSHEAWQYLCQASKMARYLNLVDINAIEDRKNPHPILKANTEALEDDLHIESLSTVMPSLYLYGLEAHKVQPYVMEIWCEKSGMNDVLLPICELYGINLVTFAGEASISAVHALAERARDTHKPIRIFYISDFDPAGKSMPLAVARKLEYLVQGEGMDIRLRQIALTIEQVRKYNLPPTPIKKSEKRASKFQERHGFKGAVELDALEAIHQGALADIVREAIEPYFDAQAHNAAIREHRLLTKNLRAQARQIMEKYEEELKAIEALNEELEAIEVPKHSIKESEYRAEEDDDDWLFDSERDYMIQMDYYLQFKGEL